MRFCLLIILCSAFHGLLSQRSLVGNTDGTWLIYGPNEHIELPPSYHYVGNFDENGLAIYAEYGRFGVLNEKGKVISPARFTDLKSLGHGIFKGLTATATVLMDVGTEGLGELPIDNCEQLTPNWWLVTEINGKSLLNTGSQRKIPLTEKDSILHAGFNFIHLRSSNNTLLLDPIGDTIELSGRHPYFQTNYLMLDCPLRKLLAFRHKVIEIPVTASNFAAFGDMVTYSDGGKTVLLNSEAGDLIMELPYDRVTLFNTHYFLVEKAALWGLIDQNGKEFIPCKYSFVRASGNYFVVGNSNGNGLLDEAGSELLPCKYKAIRWDEQFFYVSSVLDLYGLISRVNPRLRIDCMYLTLGCDGRRIRATTGNYVRLIEINKDHEVVSNVLLENVITVQSRNGKEDGRTVDTRLYELGWFDEQVPTFDDQGYANGSMFKWGLHGNNDTVLLNPRYNEPTYVPAADFSLLPNGSIMHRFYGNAEVKIPTFSATSYLTGRPIITDFILSVDTTDLLERNFCRFFSNKGLGILQADNQVRMVDYIDPSDASFLRYCTSVSHTISPSKDSDPESVGLPTWNQNDPASYSTSIKNYDKETNIVKFPEAKWNFLDTNGRPLFSEDFDYVKPYYAGTSIVKKGARWGVVNRDTLIIPTGYASIVRVAAWQDTAFLVKRMPQGERLLDSLLQEVDPGITRHLMSTPYLSLIENRSVKRVMNQQHVYVSDSASLQKIISEKYIVSKRRKEYLLRDENGKLLGTFPEKPLAVYRDRYVLLESRGKQGMLDFFGDTLLDFTYKLIECKGHFILGIDQVDNPVFNEELTLLFKAKDGRVLVDESMNNVALVRGGKCIVYNESGTVVRRQSSFSPGIFHNNWLIELGPKGKAFSILEGDVGVQGDLHSCQPMDGFGFLVDNLEGKYTLYDEHFKPLTDSLNLRNAKYLGEGCILARVDRKMVLINQQQCLPFPHGLRVIGKFNSGFLLIKTQEEYSYLNRELVNSFKREFSEARPFEGAYASVEEGEGWTLIDQRGNRKSLGAYSEIEPLGNGMYSTAAQALYGVFDQRGKEILPAEFQEITFLGQNLIQAIREGNIEYFDAKGQPVTPSTLAHDLTFH